MIEPTTGGRGVQQQRDNVPGDQIPFVNHMPGGKGVQQQRAAVPRDGMPHVNNASNTGQGVSAQRAAVPRDGMPHVQADGKGRGVNMQRVDVPGDRMPRMPTKSDGQGVAAQRRTGPGAEPRDGIPYVGTHKGSRGVAIQRNGGAGNGTPAMPELVDPANGILDGSRLRPWFHAIAERLARCIILNRSWESALTDSVLQQTPSSPKPSVGVFLDPPYRTTCADGSKKRSTGLYQGDKTGASDALAKATYEWATEGRNKLGERYADKYRIAYCMHEGDFPIPPGWTFEVMGFSGHRDQEKKKELDCVMFSPACVPVPTDPQGEFDW